MNDILLDRCKGALIGLAVGDALGTTNEFKRSEDVTIIDSIVGGGPFDLEPGEWTDDTSMALCLAESLIENGFNLKDQLERYDNWLKNGYMSCTGTCFDIGSTTYTAINKFNITGDVFSGDTSERASGNGNIMRLAPVVIKYYYDINTCVSAAEMQSVTTHGSLICKEAAAFMAEFMWSMLHRDSDIDSKDWMYQQSSTRNFITSEIKAINNFEFLTKEKDEVFHHGGFVASSLEFALWCFHNTDNYKDCVLLAANAGGDSDTNAAIAGQIAGAYYGLSGIPPEWTKKISWNKRIIEMVDELIK
jgi:ADP-ribosyl-[dinitrogen reductase] hydrolase